MKTTTPHYQVEVFSADKPDGMLYGTNDKKDAERFANYYRRKKSKYTKVTITVLN